MCAGFVVVVFFCLCRCCYFILAIQLSHLLRMCRFLLVFISFLNSHQFQIAYAFYSLPFLLNVIHNIFLLNTISPIHCYCNIVQSCYFVILIFCCFSFFFLVLSFNSVYWVPINWCTMFWPHKYTYMYNV